MTRRSWAAWIPLALVMALLGVGLAFVLNSVEQNAEQLTQAQAESQARQDALDVLATDVRALREQVESTGQEPVAPEPEERVDDIGDVEDVEIRPTPKPLGPTVAQVRSGVQAVLADNPDLIGQPLVSAVTAYLVANPPPPGEDGQDGEPGRPPTPEETLVAVQTVCANDACVGRPGADAPPVTDEQVAAQLAAYCNARGECRGDDGRDGTNGTDGTDGTNGAPGEDGRGIVDVDCRDDGALVFTFDKPPLEEVLEDACLAEAPPPEPTEFPTGEPTSPGPT